MRRPKVLFICGSINQTTQLEQVSRQLPEVQAWFTPYYGDAWLTKLRDAGLLEYTIAGHKLRQRCLRYLTEKDLAVDVDGARGGYDLVVTCSDVIVPENATRAPLVAVQEGILDPATPLLGVVRRFPKLVPRWLVGTAATGLSGLYQRFCVASDGYREHFIRLGAPADRVVVTGMPNFDDCSRYLKNDFPFRNFVLACTSDARETLKLDRRKAFIQSARERARGRPLVFKLHPNERMSRAVDEIRRWAPEARIYTSGSAEAMVANCDVLVTQFSSLVFVGLALGKEVHSYHPLEELRRLLPVQNRSAAKNIARVCRELLDLPTTSARPELQVAG